MKELFSSFSFIFNYFNTQPLEEKNPRTSKASQVAAASAGSLTSLTSSKLYLAVLANLTYNLIKSNQAATAPAQANQSFPFPIYLCLHHSLNTTTFTTLYSPSSYIESQSTFPSHHSSYKRAVQTHKYTISFSQQ